MTRVAVIAVAVWTYLVVGLLFAVRADDRQRVRCGTPSQHVNTIIMFWPLIIPTAEIYPLLFGPLQAPETC